MSIQAMMQDLVKFAKANNGMVLMGHTHGHDSVETPDGTPSEERYSPRCEYSHDRENYYVRVACGSGVAPDQVQVKIVGDLVKVEANLQRKLRPDEVVDETEISYGIIETTLTPPKEEVSIEKMKAEFFNGLLILSFPKLKADPAPGPEPEPKAVAVDVIR